MADYSYVKTLSGYAGTAYVFETEKGHVMVSRAHTFDRGDETMIFEWDVRTGKVKSWSDLYAGYGEDHEVALRNWLSK